MDDFKRTSTQIASLKTLHKLQRDRKKAYRMNVKTFRAESLMEALHQVHEEFGVDAKIEHTREVEEKSFFGLRRRKYVEITATGAESAQKQATETPADDEFHNDFLQQIRTSPYDILPTTPNDFADEISNHIVSKKERPIVPTGLWRSMTPETLNPSVLQRSLIAQFESMVRFGGPLNLADGRKATVALLGPSGVGKTATLAKIAAHYRLKEFRRVGFVTIDTYRIAAADQLAKYADTLDCPVETVTEPFRMKSALKRLGHCDLVLLDTPGINPKNAARLQTLAEMLDAADDGTLAESLERHLVLPATGSAAFLLDMLRRFEPLRPTDLTFTKLDEASAPGDLYRLLKDNAQRECPLTLRFCTLGQNMAEDIEVASPARLASLA